VYTTKPIKSSGVSLHHLNLLPCLPVYPGKPGQAGKGKAKNAIMEKLGAGYYSDNFTSNWDLKLAILLSRRH